MNVIPFSVPPLKLPDTLVQLFPPPLHTAHWSNFFPEFMWPSQPNTCIHNIIYRMGSSFTPKPDSQSCKKWEATPSTLMSTPHAYSLPHSICVWEMFASRRYYYPCNIRQKAFGRAISKCFFCVIILEGKWCVFLTAKYMFGWFCSSNKQTKYVSNLLSDV